MEDWRKAVVSIFKEVITPTVVFCWVVTSVVVALAGPFGTFESRPLLWRLGYWSCVIGASIPIAFACRLFWKNTLEDPNPLVEDMLVIGTMSVIFGPLVVSFNVWLVGPDVETVMSWPLATVVTFFVGLGIVALRRLSQDPPSEPPKPLARDRLLDRIGAPEGVRLARISSDNHHIRITTDDGVEHRILMRLRDAVDEIDVEPGMCVHRSHWVATAHIAAVVDQDGKEMVRMPCGGVVPVGPKYRVNLVGAGVLAA